MREPYLSVIIPAFDEAARLGKTLSEIISFLGREPYESEIIVVDDGSRDGTAEVAEKRLSDFPHEVLKNPFNKGKGRAVRQGMLKGRGKFLLFTDADLSTPIEEVRNFLRQLHQGYDIVIGSRAHPQSNLEVRQNPIRENMGKIFNRLARRLAFREVRDSQCGFKCFKREAAKDLFSRQKLEGFSFDAEIIYLAQRLGYKILEAPVTWRNSPQSRVRVLTDPVRMLRDLVRIRWSHRNLTSAEHAD